MLDSEVIHEYQQFLIDSHNTTEVLKISNYLMSGHNRPTIEKYSTIILRYVVEDILHWTPQEMYYKLNAEIIKKFELRQILSYITTPPEAGDTDYFVYAHILYPDKIELDSEKLTIITYEKMLEGKLQKYPRNFFEDDKGRRRAIICLHYCLMNNENFSSIEEMYSLFSNTSQAQIFLRKYKLTPAYMNGWNSYLQYLHDALGTQASELLLHQYTCYLTMPKFLTQEKPKDEQ